MASAQGDIRLPRPNMLTILQIISHIIAIVLLGLWVLQFHVSAPTSDNTLTINSKLTCATA